MPGERFIVGPQEVTPDDEKNIYGGSCQDITGRTISAGNHYVPGPDSCTVCLCDQGRPKWCQAVLCAAPKDCKSFRVGSSCCEFICLDDDEGGRDVGAIDINWVNGELGLRLVATAVTAILSLALLAFLFYRLKRRRGRRHPACHGDVDEGDRAGSSSDLGSFDHGDLTSSTGHLSRQPPPFGSMRDHQSPVYLLWKQPTTSADHPPPYSETHSRATAEDAHQETIGLLSVPSAPPSQDMPDTVTSAVLARMSNATLNSEYLEAGTPPPTYAEVLAFDLSSPSMEQITRGDEPALPLTSSGEVRLERRVSASLPRQRSTNADAAIQRFSLQLALDCSDTSSSSSSLASQVPPLSTSSSSSSESTVANLADN